MKRQVAILGDTPEFLRWSVRMDCLLREDTDLDSIDQTEKRLRAIRALGLAIGQQRVHDGIAVQKLDDQWKGFRVDEVTAFWNGRLPIETACIECRANLLCDPNQHGTLAGCHGWLPRRIEQSNPASRFDIGDEWEALLNEEDRQQAEKLFLATRPTWYGVWSGGQLSGDALIWASQQINRLVARHPKQESLVDFSTVLDACNERELTLDVELVPAGHSDGLHWRIGVHCDRCKWPFEEGQRHCGCCNKAGQGHPMRKRRVLGMRPYVDLEILLGEQAEAFRAKWNLTDSCAPTKKT